MRISNSYTRVAVAFDDKFAKMLVEKYHLQNLKQPKHFQYYHPPEDLVSMMYGNFREEFAGWVGQNQAVTLTEWMLQSIANRSGGIADYDRFSDAAEFYFKHRNDPKFISVVKQLNKEESSDTLSGEKSKSILLFSLDDLEDIKYLYFLDPNENKISSKLPTGAELIHTGKKYQIVKTKSVGAACSLASGTKWCTSGEEKAREYLNKGPLYIIYINGKKFGQLHVTREGTEFGDLRNRELMMDKDLKDTLVHLGILA